MEEEERLKRKREGKTRRTQQLLIYQRGEKAV